MNTHILTRLHAAPRLKRTLRACTGLLAAVMLAACGGGGGSTASNGVGVGGTGSAAGPVSGFGSIIVNGVRFDYTAADVFDDSAPNTRLDPTTIKLGMQVEVQSGAITDDLSTGLQKATATQIVYGSSIKGRVTQAPDTTNRTIAVLGQTISVPTSTVFVGYVNGLNDVQNGDAVEIHAFLGSGSGAYTATRVEKLSALGATCKLVGIVSSPPNATNLTIGALSVNYSGVSNPPSLSSSSRVKVELTVSSGACSTTASKLVLKSVSLPDSTRTELSGIVSDFVNISSFKVNGVAVQAPGNTTVVANGNRVEVEGSANGGIVTALEVKLDNGGGSDEIRLFGAAANLNSANKWFDVQGVSVDYSNVTPENGLTTSNFSDGTALEVRGALNPSGTRVIATRIKRKS